MLPYSNSYKPKATSNNASREQMIMKQCARIGREIKQLKESNQNQWRVRRLQKSLYHLTSQL